MSQSSETTSRLQVFEDDGTPLQATFSVQVRDGKPSILFYARNGSKGGIYSQNTKYEIGLERLIERLAAGGARIDEATLAGRAGEPALVGPPLDLRGADPYKVRRRLQVAQGGGQVQKMRLFISGLNVPHEHIEEYLSRGIVGSIEARDAKEGPEPTVISRTEGGTRVRLSKKAERDPRLRADAIKIHGTSCKACGDSFGERYGDWGEVFIEVHHLVPLSEGERHTDPEKDLVPLCSNCHRMVHLKPSITLTIEELRAKLRPNLATG